MDQVDAAAFDALHAELIAKLQTPGIQVAARQFVTQVMAIMKVAVQGGFVEAEKVGAPLIRAVIVAAIETAIVAAL